MRVLPYYDEQKKIITFLIGIGTLVAGTFLSIIVFKLTNHILLVITLAVLTCLLSVFLPQTYRKRYFSIPKIDLSFYEHPERRFPTRL